MGTTTSKVVPREKRKKEIPKIIVSEGNHQLEYKNGRVKDLGKLNGYEIVALYRKYHVEPPQNIADYYMRFFWDEGAR